VTVLQVPAAHTVGATVAVVGQKLPLGQVRQVAIDIADGVAEYEPAAQAVIAVPPVQYEPERKGTGVKQTEQRAVSAFSSVLAAHLAPDYSVLLFLLAACVLTCRACRACGRRGSADRGTPAAGRADRCRRSASRTVRTSRAGHDR
jgi:hypothetical protein